MNQDVNSVWIRAYYKGFQVSLTFTTFTPEDAVILIERAIASGFTPTVEDMKSTEHKELIDTVVRREHIDKRGNSIPVIDLYPKWQGDFGQFRFTSIYIDTEEDAQAFEAQSGLRIKDLPVYESQAPLSRNVSRPHRCEVVCVTPFEAIKEQNGEKEVNGVTQMTYKFSRYANAPTSAPKPTPTPPTDFMDTKEYEGNFVFKNVGETKTGEPFAVFESVKDSSIRVNVFKRDRVSFFNLKEDQNTPTAFNGIVVKNGNFWNLKVVNSF